MNYRDIAALFILALLIRLLAALPQQQPNYMDAAYSYVNALNLAAGRGFVEDFVWNYLDNPEPPPHPSHLYWMPLTSILAWLGMVIGGLSYRAAQLPLVVVSALLAPISYWAAWSLSGQRRPGWLAGLLAIFSGFYFPFWTAIDNFTPFAVAGSLALLLAWRGLDQAPTTNNRGQDSEDRKLRDNSPLFWLFGAGLLVGLAHLARADGPLLLVAIILTALLRLAFRLSRSLFYTLFLAIFPILGYLLMMLPWFIRNRRVTGTFFPVAGSKTIWLPTAADLFSSYAFLFSYKPVLSAEQFFAQGLGPILQGRWWVLGTNLQTVLAVWGMIFLTPLALVGAWRLRYHLLVQIAGLYAVLLFLVMTLVFAFPGALGGLFHSGAALLPFIYATAVIGLDHLVDWVAARRRRWDAALAKQVFGVGLVVMALFLSGFIYYGRVIKNDTWNKADRTYEVVAEWMQQQDPEATVMINNPPAYRYHGGGLSVVVPNEDLETTLQAARQYQVDYLILGPNHPAPLHDLYNQTVTHPQLSLVKTFGDLYIYKVRQP